MAYHVAQANFNRRIRAVSAWSLQRTAQAILAMLRTMTNPVTEQLRELYQDPSLYQPWFFSVKVVDVGANDF
jgi:mitochondrial distribution and morphology protein 31